LNCKTGEKFPKPSVIMWKLGSPTRRLPQMGDASSNVKEYINETQVLFKIGGGENGGECIFEGPDNSVIYGSHRLLHFRGGFLRGK